MSNNIVVRLDDLQQNYEVCFASGDKVDEVFDVVTLKDLVTSPVIKGYLEERIKTAQRVLMVRNFRENLNEI